MALEFDQVLILQMFQVSPELLVYLSHYYFQFFLTTGYSYALIKKDI